MKKERIQLHLSPEVATALRIEAAKLGTQGAMSKIAEKILREGLGMAETYYLVQMVKGTDNAFDETSKPRTLLKTTDKQEALDYYATLPEYVELDEPETDLEGREKYESPVVIEVSPDAQTLIKG